jgi:hypothetical protein
VPYEHIDSTGQIDGANMTKPGDAYSFVRTEGQNVVLTDPAGGSIRVPITATDYVAPKAATPVPTVAPAPSPYSVGMSNQSLPIHPVAHNQRALGSGGDSKIAQVNQILGMPLFDGSNLWDENGDDVGKRLDWKKDSISSYRIYDDRPAIKLHLGPQDTQDDDPVEAIMKKDQPPGPDPSVTSDSLGRSLVNY